MASTQKNPPRKTSTSTSKARTQTSKKAPPPKKNSSGLLERILAAIFCFLLSMFLILNMFQVKAVVINLFAGTVKGIIGYGFWFAVPALLLTTFLLLFRTRSPITLRIWCALLLPILFGALLHVFLDRDLYQLSLQGLKQLWYDGQDLHSAGVLSGFLSVLFTQLFSAIGASVIFILMMLTLLLGALHITPEVILSGLHRFKEYVYSLRYHDDEDDYYEEEDRYEPAPPPVPAPKRAKRQTIDLPVDDPPLLEENAPEPLAKRSLFNRTSKVKTPDEVLSAMKQTAEEPTSTQTPVEEPPAPVMPTESISPPVPVASNSLMPEPLNASPSNATPPPETKAERELSKNERRELIREHQESVAKDVANVLEAVPPVEYEFPSINLLHEMNTPSQGAVQEELSAIQQRLSDTISSFGIVAKISGAVRGPSITRYEVELDQGVRLNKLTNLSDDIALALGASSVRIAPVPGKISLVGIEVPNKKITPVPIREVIASETFSDNSSKVSFAVGKDIGGNYIIGDIAKLPHLLIAGTTGSGKSVCTNSLIISMLYKSTPEEVRLIMVDPKMVELGIYNGIPHLLIPVVTDPKKAAGALQWAVVEMMKRYRMFSEVGVRDLSSYNAHAARSESMQKLPQIVVVIDELADLMLVAAKEVEESICRVAQMGRASGMHLIIATQRPSADVITGLMKANIPSRIAFAVASSLESRIILDTQGAEKLVGKGDMLWFPLGSGKPLRVQGCLIDDQDVAAVVAFVKESGDTDYDEAVLQEIEQHTVEQGKGSKSSSSSSSDPISDDGNDDFDELFPNAVDIVMELGQASVSMLQRRLKLGYSRAARLVDQMEDRGIVGPFEGSKPRQLLLSREKWDEMQGRKRETDQLIPPVQDEILPEPDPLPLSTEYKDPQDEAAPPWEEDPI